jgi:hypothetical protein
MTRDSLTVSCPCGAKLVYEGESTACADRLSEFTNLHAGHSAAAPAPRPLVPNVYPLGGPLTITQPLTSISPVTSGGTLTRGDVREEIQINSHHEAAHAAYRSAE